VQEMLVAADGDEEGDWGRRRAFAGGEGREEVWVSLGNATTRIGNCRITASRHWPAAEAGNGAQRARGGERSQIR
jgi:hypothetical protein